jgi:hypothetical protein
MAENIRPDGSYYVPGYGWIDAETVAEIDACDGWEERFPKRKPVHSAADDLTALLTDLRDLLWRYRDFCPEAVELRIRCGEVLDMLGDAKEVKVR